MPSKLTFSGKIILFFKGLAMGMANKVPGVSGGAIAFVLGFYEELIYTLKKINLRAFKLLVNGRFRSLYKYLNLPFLVLVMGGSLFSYFTVSIILNYLLEKFEIQVWSTFFGIIMGSIYYLGKRHKPWNLKSILIGLLGTILGISLSFIPSAVENSNLWFVFFCGIIGIIGMIIPGLSGSFLLILLGNYVLLLVDSVNVIFEVTVNFLIGNFVVLEDAENIKYIKIALTFFVGSTVGLISLSHILGYVLKRWHHIVVVLIIGFITGSLGMVWPWKEKIYKLKQGLLVLDSEGNAILENYRRYFPNFSDLETWIAIIFISLGILIVLGLDHYENKS